MLTQSSIDKLFLNNPKYSTDSNSTMISQSSSYSSDEEGEMNHSMKNIQRKPKISQPYSYFQKHRLHVTDVSTVSEYAYYDEVNIIHRDDMEDGYFLKENYLEDKRKTLFFGVFDGHHGKDVVEVIIKYFAPKFKKIYNKQNNENIIECFEQAFEVMNKKIDKKVTKKDIGSTAFVGIIREEFDGTRKFYYANCGDTSGYLFNNNNDTIKQIGEIHRLTNDKELQRVKEMKGDILYERIGGILENSRSFGDFFQSKNGIIATPHTNSLEITEDLTYMIIGSDGLTDFISERELLKLVNKQNNNCDKIADGCLSTCIVNKSNDNISIMVIKLN